jgi:hypothetical protein
MSESGEEKDFDKLFSEIIELSNIDDFDSIIESEVFKTIKDYMLMVSSFNEFNHHINTLIFSVLEKIDINLNEEARELLGTIYKLIIDFNDIMVELDQEDFDLEDDEEENFLFDDDDDEE